MSSKINLQISKLSKDELLESMDMLVMQLEQRFGSEATDELLYQLIAQRVTRIYIDKPERHCSSLAQNDHFCLDLEQAIQLEDLRTTLHAVLASIEVQLGSVASEMIMYQIMYRLGVRNGKYDEEQEDDTDNSDEYYDDEDDAELKTGTKDKCIIDKYELSEWQSLSYNKNVHNNHKGDNARVLMESNDEDINKANEEYEQNAKN